MAAPDQTARWFLGNRNGYGDQAGNRSVGERRIRQLPLWQSVQIWSGVGQLGDRALSVQSGQPGGSDRSVFFQERSRSQATAAVSLFRQDGFTPRMVVRSTRDTGRSGHCRLATDRQSLHRPGRQEPLVLRLGSHPSRRCTANHKSTAGTHEGHGSHSRIPTRSIGRRQQHLYPDIRYRGLGSRQACSPKHLQLCGQESCDPPGKEKGTLRFNHRKGEGTNSRPTSPGGLQLGEGQHGVACQRRPRHRSRSRWRTHGIPMVVRD